MKQLNNEIPRIYVACLAAYNNGYLHGAWSMEHGAWSMEHGAWIDVTDTNAIYQAIHKMLAESPVEHAEEWAIHAYENFGSLYLDEHMSIDEVVKIADFISKYGELGTEILSHFGLEFEQAEKALEDTYYGAYESEIDFATNFFDDCYAHEIRDNLKFYIDYEAFARDLFLCDYFSIDVQGVKHIFSCC